MMRITTTLSAAILALLMCTPSTAMGPGHGGHERRVARMLDTVSANDSQREQIWAIVDASRSDMRQLHRQIRQLRQLLHGLDTQAADYLQRVELLAAQKSELMQQVMLKKAGIKRQIGAVLNASQRQQISAMRQRAHPRRHQRPPQL